VSVFFNGSRQKLYLLSFFIVMALALSGCTFSRYSRKSFERAKAEKPFDVVIVPGVPYEGDSTTIVMKMRLHWAKFLYDSGFTKNIIFSGSAVYTPYVEGIVMKVMADSLGIPRDRTFSETKAEHSTENVYYSSLMAKEMGFKKIGLATDQFQAGLLRRFMRRHCPEVKAIPIIRGTLNIDQKVLPEIDPSSAHVENFISITKKESFFKRLRYTLGKRVKDERRKARRLERKKKKNSDR
jgi:uncharacterized SAM-binding protein YcdF (DUF218 family)